MSREIKFRVWDKRTKHFILPWTGPGHDEVEIAFTASDKWFIFGGGELLDENFALQQFTGLLDKNNKEIYEGDILKHQENNQIGVVDYNKFSCQYAAKTNVNGYFIINTSHSSDNGQYGIFDENSKHEIIGNIFENPELLTQTN